MREKPDTPIHCSLGGLGNPAPDTERVEVLGGVRRNELIEQRTLLAEHQCDVLRAVVVRNERAALDAEGLLRLVGKRRVHEGKSVPRKLAVNRGGDKRVAIGTRAGVHREGALNPLGVEGSGDGVRNHPCLLRDGHCGLVEVEGELGFNADLIHWALHRNQHLLFDVRDHGDDRGEGNGRRSGEIITEGSLHDRIESELVRVETDSALVADTEGGALTNLGGIAIRGARNAEILRLGRSRIHYFGLVVNRDGIRIVLLQNGEISILASIDFNVKRKCGVRSTNCCGNREGGLRQHMESINVY